MNEPYFQGIKVGDRVWSVVTGLILGLIIGAGISLHVHRGVLEAANSRGDVCINQLTSYQATTKAEVHRQIQTLQSKYIVLNKDLFIDAQVDLEREYHNLYAGQLPLK